MSGFGKRTIRINSSILPPASEKWRKENYGVSRLSPDKGGERNSALFEPEEIPTKSMAGGEFAEFRLTQ